MGFYNICGGLKFTVSEDGIKSVTLRGHNNEILSGTLTVGFDDAGLPVVQSITDGSESIKVYAPQDETFEVGKAYYIVFAPTIFENGFTLTFDKGYASAVYDRTKKTTIRRSAFGGLTTPDKDLEWTLLYVPIPDANFKAYMIQNFDTNGNGEIDFDEAEAVTRIQVNTDNIESVAGIEYCKHLRSLYCSGSNIWSQEINQYVPQGQLTSLCLNSNNELTDVNCSSNKLNSLDVSANSALSSLYCYDNQLTGLDVSNNIALTVLSCSNNQLKSLDVSNNIALTVLSCSNNQLTSLDVSNNTALTSLSCYSNQLTSLDVRNNTALTSLSCCSNQLTSLDVGNKTALTYLSCYSNQLTSLDVSNNTVLNYLYCDNNQLTSLDVSNNTALTILWCFSNQLTSLAVSSNTALIRLECQFNQLTSLDVSNNTALTNLICSSNKLTSLDVSNSTALTELSCSDNQLTGLDVSGSIALTRLYCDNNQLTSLDVSNSTALTNLSCSSNKLTSLNVKNNTALTYLSCNNNLLTSLDVSKNLYLNSLRCVQNYLSFYGGNYLGYLYIAQGQTIQGITVNRSTNYIPDDTIIAVAPGDGESEGTVDESLDGNDLDDENLVANGPVLFEDDFEWIAPWASASGAGDAVGTNTPTTTAPNVFKDESSNGFFDAFSSRGYIYLWGSSTSGGWSDSLGEDNPMVLYIQTNYLKLGKTDYNCAIKLPPFENINDAADVVLSFDWAWQVTNAYKPDLMTLNIDVEGEGAYYGRAIESSQSRTEGSSEIAWQHVKVIVNGIRSGSRIAICPSSCDPNISNPSRRQNRWYLDNIKVVKK